MFIFWLVSTLWKVAKGSPQLLCLNHLFLSWFLPSIAVYHLNPCLLKSISNHSVQLEHRSSKVSPQGPFDIPRMTLMSCKCLYSLRSSSSSCEYLVSFCRLEPHPNITMLKLLADNSPFQNALKHKLSHSLLQEVSAYFAGEFFDAYFCDFLIPLF